MLFCFKHQCGNYEYGIISFGFRAGSDEPSLTPKMRFRRKQFWHSTKIRVWQQWLIVYMTKPCSKPTTTTNTEASKDCALKKRFCCVENWWDWIILLICLHSLFVVLSWQYNFCVFSIDKFWAIVSELMMLSIGQSYINKILNCISESLKYNCGAQFKFRMPSSRFLWNSSREISKFKMGRYDWWFKDSIA